MRQTSHNPVLMPVTRFDRERLAGAFERMSRQSRYQRFLHPKPTLSDAELTYFTDIDHRTHDAIAAVDPVDGSFVGVARYAVLDERVMSADLAFFVVDDWQGHGVATTLLRTLLPARRPTASTASSPSRCTTTRRPAPCCAGSASARSAPATASPS